MKAWHARECRYVTPSLGIDRLDTGPMRLSEGETERALHFATDCRSTAQEPSPTHAQGNRLRIRNCNATLSVHVTGTEARRSITISPNSLNPVRSIYYLQAPRYIQTTVGYKWAGDGRATV